MFISIDTETTKAPRHLPWIPGSYLVSLSIARSDGLRRSWLFNHPESTISQRECIDSLKTYLAPCKRIIAHNLKFDLTWLDHIGLDTASLALYCTQVAGFILNGQQKEGLKLNDLAEQFGLPLKKDKVKLMWEEGYETDEIPASVLNEYCEHDAWLALEIYKRQVEKIKKRDIEMLVSLDMESLRYFQQAEYAGMRVDITQLKTYGEDYATQIEYLDLQLRDLLGDINFGSSEQLSCALYGGSYLTDGYETVKKELKSGKIKEYQRKCKVEVTLEGAGFKPLKDTETKKDGIYKTSADILQQLKTRTKKQKQIISCILERAKLTKMKSTYFDGLLERQIEGYVHPSINQTIAVTGRLTSSNPNGQNIPRGSTGPAKKPFISRYALA